MPKKFGKIRRHNNIKTNGTGGKAPYTVTFTTNGIGTITQPIQTGLGEGIDAITTYTVPLADGGNNVTFTAVVLDSCNKSSLPVSCTVLIDCNTPVANLEIS